MRKANEIYVWTLKVRKYILLDQPYRTVFEIICASTKRDIKSI